MELAPAPPDDPARVPTASIYAFLATLFLACVSLSAFRIFVLGRFEQKWSPAWNFALDAFALALVTLLAFVPFALGVALARGSVADWRRGVAGGVAIATLLEFSIRAGDRLALPWWLMPAVGILACAALGAWSRRAAVLPAA